MVIVTQIKRALNKIIMILGIPIIFVGIIGIVMLNILGLIIVIAGALVYYYGYNYNQINY